MLDQRRTEVQAFGEGALKGFYQELFPAHLRDAAVHIFTSPVAPFIHF